MRTHRPDKTERLMVRLTPELKNALETAAKKSGVSQNSFICIAIQRLTEFSGNTEVK